MPIHTILTHQDPDMDEIVAIHILKRHGESRYPGIKDADIITQAKRDFDKSPDELEAEGILCVGIGGGKYDEHPVGGRTRREGDCAATLVAKDLGLFEDPRVGPNASYALSKNYSPDTWEFEIAPLEKLAFRYLTHSDDENKNKQNETKIFEACFLLLDAAEKHYQGTETNGRATLSTDELIAKWMLDRFSPNAWPVDLYRVKAEQEDRAISSVVAKAIKKSEDRVFYWILQYAKKRRVADDGKQDTNYDLSDLVTFAQRYGYPEEKIEEAVFIFMDAIWNKYKNFFVDCKKDYNSPETRVAVLEKNGEKLLVTSVLSSNPEIARYCRSEYGKHSAVVIKKDPQTGNMQVFFNQKYGLDPKPVAKELRIVERLANGFTEELPEETLTAQGKVEGSEVWYYDGYQLLNGSHTAEEVPTKLSREEVEKAVMRGLRN